MAVLLTTATCATSGFRPSGPTLLVINRSGAPVTIYAGRAEGETPIRIATADVGVSCLSLQRVEIGSVVLGIRHLAEPTVWTPFDFDVRSRPGWILAINQPHSARYDLLALKPMAECRDGARALPPGVLEFLGRRTD